MKRITSLKKAIKYFQDGTTVKTGRLKNGKEYTTHVPPAGFRRMNITEYFYNTRGEIAGTITHLCHSWQWRDYAKELTKRADKIVKIVLYYE